MPIFLKSSTYRTARTIRVLKTLELVFKNHEIARDGNPPKKKRIADSSNILKVFLDIKKILTPRAAIF